MHDPDSLQLALIAAGINSHPAIHSDYANAIWYRRRALDTAEIQTDPSPQQHHRIDLSFDPSDIGNLTVSQRLAVQFIPGIPDSQMAAIRASFDSQDFVCYFEDLSLATHTRIPKSSTSSSLNTVTLEPPAQTSTVPQFHESVDSTDRRLFANVRNDPSAFSVLLSECVPNSLAYLRLAIQYVPLPVFRMPEAARHYVYQQSAYPHRINAWVETLSSTRVKHCPTRPVLVLAVDQDPQKDYMTIQFAPITTHDHGNLNKGLNLSTCEKALWAPLQPAREGYSMNVTPLEMREEVREGSTIWCGRPLEATLHASGNICMKGLSSNAGKANGMKDICFARYLAYSDSLVAGIPAGRSLEGTGEGEDDDDDESGGRSASDRRDSADRRGKGKARYNGNSLESKAEDRAGANSGDDRLDGSGNDDVVSNDSFSAGDPADDTPDTSLDSDASKTSSSVKWSLEDFSIELIVEDIAFALDEDEQEDVDWKVDIMSDVKTSLAQVLQRDSAEEWDGTFESDEVVW